MGSPPPGASDTAFEPSCGRRLWPLLPRLLLRGAINASLIESRGCARAGYEAGGGDCKTRRVESRRAASPPPSISASHSESFQQGIKGGQQRRLSLIAGAEPRCSGSVGLGAGVGPASAARVPGEPPSPAPTLTAPEWPPSSPRAGSGPRRCGRREQGREGSRGAASGAARAGAAGKASPGALRHPHPPPPRPAAGSDPRYRAAVGGGTGWPGPADSARLRDPHRSPRPPGRRPGAPGAGAEAGSRAAFRKAAEEIRTPSGPRGFLEKQAPSSGSSLATTLTMEASPAAFVTHGCPHPATGLLPCSYGVEPILVHSLFTGYGPF